MSQPRTAKTNLWGTGVAVFAAAVMVLGGLVGIANGVIALKHDVVLSAAGGYVFAWDADGWGWVHIILGILLVATGLAIMANQEWARLLGTVVAMFAAFGNFLWLPYYPVAAIIAFAINVLVMWALATLEPAS